MLLEFRFKLFEVRFAEPMQHGYDAVLMKVRHAIPPCLSWASKRDGMGEILARLLRK
ncbi:MAG: hypothetical protein LZF86_190615 [Nitrospira sp.]|nr:MAG: hypothetical protein LZF86_190615 [Nitrospira sp.]